MVEKIRIQNLVTNKSIVIGLLDRPFILDSVDWDAPSVSMETYRVPFQIGSTVAGATVGTRKPSITGYVVATESSLTDKIKTWNEYYGALEQQVEDSKQVLDTVISIYQDVLIEANGYFLKARPTQPPKYSNNSSKNNEVMCLFQLEFECFSPMFYSDSKLVNLASISEKLTFPLVLPPEGAVFGEIFKQKSVPIANNGSSNAGCTIKITAVGGVVKNPKVYNVNTNDFIAFEGISLNDGDYITVTTTVGEENAILHRVSDSSEISIVGYTTKGSKYIQIEQGTNYYAYDVDDQYLNSIEVSIEFTEQFFNIRGM